MNERFLTRAPTRDFNSIFAQHPARARYDSPGRKSR